MASTLRNTEGARRCFTYDEAVALYNSIKPLPNNDRPIGDRGRVRIRVIKDYDKVAVRYHATDVVKWYKDGMVVVDDGCWSTVSTRNVINSVSPYVVSSYNCRTVVGLRSGWYIVPDGGLEILRGEPINPKPLYGYKVDRKLAVATRKKYKEQFDMAKAIIAATNWTPELVAQYKRMSFMTDGCIAAEIHDGVDMVDMLVEMCVCVLGGRACIKLKNLNPIMNNLYLLEGVVTQYEEKPGVLPPKSGRKWEGML